MKHAIRVAPRKISTKQEQSKEQTPPKRPAFELSVSSGNSALFLKNSRQRHRRSDPGRPTEQGIRGNFNNHAGQGLQLMAESGPCETTVEKTTNCEQSNSPRTFPNTPKAPAWSNLERPGFCAPRATRRNHPRGFRAADVAGSRPSTECFRARPIRESRETNP